MPDEVVTPPAAATPPPAEPGKVPSGDGPPPLKEGAAPPAEPAGDKKVSTPPAPVVPEKYDLKPSEGSFLNAKDLEKIAAAARERGLSQQDAQAFLVDQEKEVADRIDAQSQAWAEEAQNDKEIGGAAFNENVQLAKRLVDRFGSERLKQEMNRLGYGNHPEWIRLFSKIGKHFVDDKAVFPGSSGSGKVDKSLEEILYPDMFKKAE